MVFSGDIKDFSLPEILQLIGMGRKTGKLTVNNGGDGICVYFKDGFAVFFHPLYKKDKLGEVLVKSETVKKEHIDKALRKQNKMSKKGGRLRLGTILVDMGFLTSEDLVQFIEVEIKNGISKALSERKGKFEFASEYDLSEEDITASLEVERIILDGILELDEWGEVKEKIGDPESIYVISEKLERDFVEFDIAEATVFSLIDGKRSIKEITAAAGLEPLDVCKALTRLIQNEVINLVERPH
jgi:hypothetical protein